jgi:hypothetical protein
MTPRFRSRRQALAFGGGLSLALAGFRLSAPSAAGRVLLEGDAYAQWRLWDDPSIRATPLALIAAGVLAANPHDTQPWLFRIRDDTIDVLADLARNLGAMDAYVREMHLGLGCAIENMAIAAGSNGYDAEVLPVEGSLADLSERRGPVVAASIKLKARAWTAPDDLYRAIALRHTNRYAYEPGRAIPTDWHALARQTAAENGARLILFDAGEDRRAFDAAVVEATEAIIADKTMIADSDRWFRSSRAEIEAHRDGPTLDAAGLSFFVWMFARLFPVSPGMSHAAWLKQTRDVQLASAPVTGLIAVRDRYDRKATIAAGRVWQRLHLSATAYGLAMQPLNQPIEMIDRERQAAQSDQWAKRIANLTGDDWQATFSFRAGYSSHAAPPSPRRKLADVLMG